MADATPTPASVGNYEPQRLVALRTRLPDAAITVTNLFRMYSPDVITMLYVAVYYNDAELLQRALVRLRGSSAVVGGIYVAQLCGAAETLLESKQMDVIATLIPRIEEAVDDLLSVLPKWDDEEPLRVDAG